MKKLDDAISKSNESLNQMELISKSIDFSEEAKNNKRRATAWLGLGILSLIGFLMLLLWLIFCDSHSKEIIIESAKEKVVEPYTPILLASYIATKAVFISALLFIISWFLKSYRSEKHNYVVNKHKAMSLM